MDRVDKDPGFRTPVEELEHLHGEMAAIRSLLREAVNRLAQIERHVRRAFPDAKPGKPVSPSKPQARSPEEGKPSLVHETALMLFESLRDVAGKEGNRTVEERLSQLSIADIRFLSQELGLPSGSKQSRAKLNAGIIGRLNESILLSRNINVTQSRSEQQTESDSVDSGDENINNGPTS